MRSSSGPRKVCKRCWVTSAREMSTPPQGRGHLQRSSVPLKPLGDSSRFPLTPLHTVLRALSHGFVSAAVLQLPTRQTAGATFLPAGDRNSFYQTPTRCSSPPGARVHADIPSHDTPLTGPSLTPPGIRVICGPGGGAGGVVVNTASQLSVCCALGPDFSSPETLLMFNLITN